MNSKTSLNKRHTLLLLLALTALQLSAHNGVKLKPKMFLSGAMGSNGLMRDDLRSKGYLPSTEPYSALPNFQHYGEGGGEAIVSPGVFAVTGNDAIVDWVVVELRDVNAMHLPVSTHAALLQRDGDVVSMDGISPVRFMSVEPGQYFVAVRHRNHLGVMTALALGLSNDPVSVDFTNSQLALYGTNPCSANGTTRSLWLGDTNRDKKVLTQGPGNDIIGIFTSVLYSAGNTENNINFMYYGYSQADMNMDGVSVYNGPNNDRAAVFAQMSACQNGICDFSEQIP